MMIYADLTGNRKKWEIKNSYGNKVDSLAAAANNRQLEGDDPASLAVSEPRRLGNYQQISSKTVQSSGTAQAVDFAGRKSTQAYQLAKRNYCCALGA